MELNGWNNLLKEVQSIPRKKKVIKYIKIEEEPEPFWRADKERLCSSGVRLGKENAC